MMRRQKLASGCQKTAHFEVARKLSLQLKQRILLAENNFEIALFMAIAKELFHFLQPKVKCKGGIAVLWVICTNNFTLRHFSCKVP